MLCSCGFKNNENSNYCSSCGKQLIDQKVFRETNQGGIRKTLKSVARFMPKKNISLNLLISFIIVVIILIISSIISENQTNQSLITIITSGFLFLMITYINQNLIRIINNNTIILSYFQDLSIFLYNIYLKTCFINKWLY